MEGWLSEELRAAAVQAPQGFAYQGHSLRSGGTSAMAAIGVERHIYIWLGGWVRGSDVVDRLYVDPTILPTPAAYALYGWALSRQYQAGPAEIIARHTHPDPMRMRPAAGHTPEACEEPHADAQQQQTVEPPTAAAAAAARIRARLSLIEQPAGGAQQRRSARKRARRAE